MVRRPPQQPGGQPGNILPVQLTTQTTFVRGDDIKAMAAAAAHAGGGAPKR